jgi:hypothetical protein
LTTHKVVRPGSKGLNDGDFVSECLAPRPLIPPINARERSRPHDGKVHDHGDKNPEDGANVAKDRLGLFGKDDDDGVEQADEREWSKVGQELLLQE